MEDADQILLTSLRQAGCSFADEATSVGDLSTNDLVGICQQCVQRIEGKDAHASSLPKEMAARFKTCAELAVKMQQLGYRGELSFHQFLYPSESDTRSLLRFLIEKLAGSKSASKPRPNGKVSSRFLSALNQHNERANSHLSSSTSSHSGGKLVVPHRSQPLAIGMDKQKGIFVFGSKGFAGVRPQHVLSGQEEVETKVGEMKVEEWGVEDRKEEDAQLLALQERYNSAATALNILQEQMSEWELEYQQLGDEAEALEQETVSLEDEYLLLKETASLVLEGNMSVEEIEAELQRLIDKSRQKRADFEREWEQFAGPLELQRDELRGVGGPEREAMKTRRDATAKLGAECRELQAAVFEKEALLEELERESLFRYSQIRRDTIAKLRAECRQLEATIFEKEAEQEALLEELERTPKGAPRTAYIKRVTEIVKQIKKQEAETAKIVADVRDLQRQDNTEQDKLRRLYALVDEKIFREAKKDPSCKAAYRLLTSIHQSFGELANTATDRDRISRDVVDLEEKIRLLQKRKLDPSKVEQDLRAMQGENKMLQSRLQEQTSDRRGSERPL